jgi:outer membrane murein-binding lipoprotein Lpp
MSSSDARLVDFAQARVNRIADAIDGLAEQIKLTNSHVERLNREVADLRAEMRAGFDRVDHDLRDIRSEVILQANQIIGAQQQAMRAMMRLDDIEQRPDEPRP